MDPWKELAAWQDYRDAVRIRGDLEGKSPLMANDLAWRYALPAVKPLDTKLAITAVARLLAWAIETWWHVTRR
jgi:hypothetical protein